MTLMTPVMFKYVVFVLKHEITILLIDECLVKPSACYVAGASNERVVNALKSDF